MTGKRINGKIVVTLLIAALIGFTVSILTAALGSYLVEAETLEVDAENGIVVIALLLGSLVSALISVKQGQGTRLVMSLAGAGSYFLVLLCCGVLIFDGIRDGIAMTGLVVLGAAFVVWILGIKGDKKAKYRLPKL